MERLLKHGTISNEKATELTKNFIGAVKLTVTENETWAWFDIDELKFYLEKASEKTSVSKFVSGIRIYIGKYPETDNNGRFTVYIAPTEQDLNSIKTPNDDLIVIEALNLGGTGVGGGN